jgi:hypothetical protein
VRQTVTFLLSIHGNQSSDTLSGLAQTDRAQKNEREFKTEIKKLWIQMLPGRFLWNSVVFTVLCQSYC